MSILPDKLRPFSYYEHKLPLYLRKSYGFVEHLRIMYEILIDGVVDNGDTLLSLLDIYDEEYLTKGNIVTDMLDKIGALIGVTRNFNVTYNSNTIAIHLDNADFLLLIKTQLIKNYCDGSYRQLQKYYKKSGLNVFLVTDAPASVNVYLQVTSNNTSYSENVKNMFLAGLLTVEAMGVKYAYSFIDVNRVLLWDSNIISNLWDVGEWTI